MRMLVAAVVLVILPFAQSGRVVPVNPPAFQVVDVHVSPHRVNSIVIGGTLIGDTFAIRNATMVDLISRAYGLDRENVVGGPVWLDSDRFDVVAKTTPNTEPEMINEMLQGMLRDRFKLKVKAETRAMPGYVLTLGKGGSKLKPADGSGGGTCSAEQQTNNAGPAPYSVFSCRNITMGVFAQSLHLLANEYLTEPVVDATNLKGAWDFDVKWTNIRILPYVGQSGISVFDAVDKQLGLHLEMRDSPRPVSVVESVNEKPTDNPPEVAKTFPIEPPREFDLAVIKLSAPGGRTRVMTNFPDRIELRSVTIRYVVNLAWGFASNDRLVGAPKWFDTDHFDIVAKSTGADWTDVQPLEYNDLQRMLRTLLVERFKLAFHTEDRSLDAYTLISDKPKLEKGTQSAQSHCNEGPGPDGKDPRITTPILARLISCRNVTMAQFADQLQMMSQGYVRESVYNETGLEGVWNFTLSFSPVNLTMSTAPRDADTSTSQAGTSTGGPPDPNGALTIFDALNKQLGLGLVKLKHTVPVLVIDHIEEKPTEN
jgi:uncharacterized protein (TIGR03435 family)